MQQFNRRIAEAAELKVAAKSGDHQSEITVIDSGYMLKDSMTMITARLQKIIDMEAPIAHDRLVKKALRSFDIGRSSTRTLEATDKALKKAEFKNNKQAGVKVYWRKDQDPDTYRVYRSDVNTDEKRSPDEICQQELKNALCVTLREKGVLNKDSLVKETIRTMGYAKSGTALVAAVERGLKFGRKTGEIAMDEQKNFILKDFTS